MPLASVWSLAQAGHAPFLSRPAAVEARIVDFLYTRFAQRSSLPWRDRKVVARSFAQAAPHYDDAAGLQRQVGATLLTRMPVRAARLVLDLGSGTGTCSGVLGERFPVAESLALDMAEGMLRTARVKHRSVRTSWLCAQAENLPIADASIDVVYSSLVVQWCEDLPALFAELARVMACGGEAHIATLGPDTLWELRASWRAVDRYEHVNRFATLETLSAAAAGAGLELRELQQEYQVRRYTNVQALGRELRQLGAHNLNRGRRSGLAGRKTWQRLQQAYARLGDENGEVPATYQVVYLQVCKTGG